ncbi:class I SAM-dependent methyltransferase [Rhodococcus ruber]
MSTCRGCGSPDVERVVDLGPMPAADCFPAVDTPVTADETAHPLAMNLCRDCGLAQLAEDDSVPDEPRGVEPQALRDQAAAAVRAAASEGLLVGRTVAEFGSPHGGTWLPLLTEHGFRVAAAGAAASVVLDSFGIMHAPDQRAAFRERASAVAPGGVLLLQFHSLATIVSGGQWTALRHGHYAYYSLTALRALLAEVGLYVVYAREFELYGGTVLVAARRTPRAVPAAETRNILEKETAIGVTDVSSVRRLQRAADTQSRALRAWLESSARRRRRIFAYGAASRAVALFARAGLDRRLVTAVADASPAKQGRRMPGTDVPIVAPEEMMTAEPDRVLLTLPDLLPEVRERYRELEGRWVPLDGYAQAFQQGGFINARA